MKIKLNAQQEEALRQWDEHLWFFQCEEGVFTVPSYFTFEEINLTFPGQQLKEIAI